MKHTSLLTDYFGRLYCVPSPHNHLKLLQTLIHGSEIITAIYESEPLDINNHYFRYQYQNSTSEFVEILEAPEFRELAIKTNKFLDIWKEVINKLNFIYEKERNVFLFEDQIDDNFRKVLLDCKSRCEQILIDGFHKNAPEETLFLIKRELLTNMML
jgi:hypothetical protein